MNILSKCFALTFTGTGKYETKANHQALKGKTLVVMASNIGYDVENGQFDMMIPGGGNKFWGILSLIRIWCSVKLSIIQWVYLR